MRGKVHPQRRASRVGSIGLPQTHLLLHHLKGSEEVDGVAVLVGVGDELGVQLLVTGQADATGLLVSILETKTRDTNNGVHIL